MDRFVITGGNRLCGRLTVKGSKNAALPIMAAALLTDRPVLLRDVANLADIRNMIKLLGELGCKTEYAPSSDPKAAGGTLLLHAEDESQSHARYGIVKTMRASICALGPMLARRGYARVSMPGGCAIGDRPVDLHLRGLFEDTLVIWTTEFGRMPFTQGATGRDHNGGTFVSWFAGAGIKAGASYGSSDDFSYKAAEGQTWCYDLHATLLHLLGIDHQRLTFRYNGIDRRLTDVHGHVVHEILNETV